MDSLHNETVVCLSAAVVSAVCGSRGQNVGPLADHFQPVLIPVTD